MKRLQLFREHKYVWSGVLLLTLILGIAILAPYIAPCDPWAMGTPYLRPNSEHWLGTNDIGQDIFSELIYGTRISLFIGLSAAFITTVIGTTIGIISGYVGGKTDRVLMAITNLAIVIPNLPLTVVLVAYLKTGIWSIIIALCVTSWAGTARLVRAQVMQLKQQPFIKLEQTLGMRSGYIMLVHIFPNLGNIVFTRATLAVASAMLSEASLSFLGLGAVGQKSWGAILNNAFFRNGVVNHYWWWYYPPIICICLCVMAFMLLGSWDTRKKQGQTFISM